MPVHHRQKQLLEQYYFRCECSICKLGSNTVTDSFSQDIETLPQGWEKNIERLLPAQSLPLPADDVDYIGPSCNANTLARQQSLGFAALDEARVPSLGPEDTLTILERGIKACTQTRIWPEHRQPLASLRHEVFVSMLSAGQWLESFRCGLHFYFLIHPILYPQPFHPLRVVHKYTLARLAIWLSSLDTNGDGTPSQGLSLLTEGGKSTHSKLPSNISLGIVVLGLLIEVQDNVRYSHGESSAFALEVKRKVEEVRTDITRGDQDFVADLNSKIELQWKALRAFARVDEAQA